MAGTMVAPVRSGFRAESVSRHSKLGVWSFMWNRLTFLVWTLALLTALPVASRAQDQPKPEPETGKESTSDTPKPEGHDRPTAYPRVRFKKDGVEKVNTPDGGSKELLTRAYLLDLSAAMTATITLNDDRVVSRLERAKELLKQSLDTMSKRRDVAFNIACFGTSDDFADRKAPVSVSAESVEQAKKWVEDRVALGDSDIYGLLKVVFEQGPTSASMIVGSDPASPAGVDAKELEQAGGAQDFIIKQVEAWRKAGSKTALDVTGIGLSDTQREFYKKLAKAGGGTYLDG